MSNKINKDKEALGEGLRSLLKTMDVNLKSSENALSLRISVDDIEVNPKQPRRDFNEAALKELSDSIRLHDIIQPITVSKTGTAKFRLIAGERRWRAAKMAGLKDIPAYIRQANDAELLELALLENLKRENLNPIEIALSYKRLMDELDYTQDQVEKQMGKDRTTISNYSRLLKLPPDIQQDVRSGELSMGHARALINIDIPEKQMLIHKLIKSKHLSVRQTELLVRQMYKSSPTKKTKKTEFDRIYQQITDKLSDQFKTKVSLTKGKKDSGKITIEYFGLEQFNDILKQLGITVE